MTLDDLLENGERHARSVLLELGQKSVTGFYHLITMAATRKLAREIGAVAAVWIGEAWVASYDRDSIPRDRPMPSEAPNRMEVVVIIATDGDQTKARFLDMQRGEAGRVVALVNHVDMPIEFFGRLLDGMISPTSKPKMN